MPVAMMRARMHTSQGSGPANQQSGAPLHVDAASIAGLPKLGQISSEATPGIAPPKLLRLFRAADRPGPGPVPGAPFSPDEFERIIAACRAKTGKVAGAPASVFWRAFLFTVVDIGASAAVLRRLSDVEFSESRSSLRVGLFELQLHPSTVEAICELRTALGGKDPGGRLFPWATGTRWINQSLRNIFGWAGVARRRGLFEPLRKAAERVPDFLDRIDPSAKHELHIPKRRPPARSPKSKPPWEKSRLDYADGGGNAEEAPDVVLLQNHCRPGRTVREFVDSVYWPRRSPFCTALTKYTYTRAATALSNFSGCEVLLDQLSEDLLERFAAWRLTAGISAATVNGNLGAVCTLWRYAFRKRLLDDLPRDVEEVAAHKRLPEAWTVEQFAKILDSASSTTVGWTVCVAPAPHFWLALLLTLYDTALRVGAVLKLKVDALDAEQCWLSVPAEFQKHKAAQALRLDAKTAELLASLPREDDRLFPVPWKQPLARLERWYREILKAAGLPDGSRDLFHKIRRTNATYTADSQGEEAAQKQLGHSSISLTRNNYIDPRLVDRKRSAAALIPRPGWIGQAAVADPAFQPSQHSDQDRPAAPSMLHRAARGAHERGFGNPM